MPKKNPLYDWVKNLVIETYHYLTEDTFYELPEYPSSMLSSLYRMGDDLTNVYPLDEWFDNFDEYIDEAYIDYLDLGYEELDKQSNKEKFQQEIVMMIADEFPISVVHEPLINNGIVQEIKKPEKIAVGVGMNFTVVPPNYVTHIDLENTNLKVSLNGVEYELYKSISFDGSRALDTLLDNFGEYSIRDHSVDIHVESKSISMKM